MPAGVAPWLEPRNHVMRAPSNPLDKSTVVSIFPIPIAERKPTIEPGFFEIPAGSFDKPSILVVGSSSWWKDMPEDQPLLEIPVSSVQVADSIVRDYCAPMLAYDAETAGPGMFFIPGEFTLAEIKKNQAGHLLKAKARQDNYWKNLVKLADSLWSRSQGNPLAIGDLMRIAANELGIKDRPWLADFKTETLEPCPACGQFRNNKFPVCQHCKTIVDMERYTKLGLQQAK